MAIVSVIFPSPPLSRINRTYLTDILQNPPPHLFVSFSCFLVMVISCVYSRQSRHCNAFYFPGICIVGVRLNRARAFVGGAGVVGKKRKKGKRKGKGKKGGRGYVCMCV